MMNMADSKKAKKQIWFVGATSLIIWADGAMKAVIWPQGKSSAGTFMLVGCLGLGIYICLKTLLKHIENIEKKDSK